VAVLICTKPATTVLNLEYIVEVPYSMVTQLACVSSRKSTHERHNLSYKVI